MPYRIHCLVLRNKERVIRILHITSWGSHKLLNHSWVYNQKYIMFTHIVSENSELPSCVILCRYNVCVDSWRRDPVLRWARLSQHHPGLVPPHLQTLQRFPSTQRGDRHEIRSLHSQEPSPGKYSFLPYLILNQHQATKSEWNMLIQIINSSSFIILNKTVQYSMY